MLIKDIVKNTSNKFLNLFTIEVDNGKKIFQYYIASRRKKEELACITKDHSKCDSVMIVPIIYGEGIIMIKQYKPSINDYIYGFPEVLINREENIKKAIQRKLLEDIGVTAKEYHEFTKPSYTSVDITDETCSIYFTYVNKKSIITNKDIKNNEEKVIIPFEEIEDVINNNIIPIKTLLMLRYIIDIEE